MRKLLHPIKVFFLIWLLLFQWIIFVPESYSDEILSLKNEEREILAGANERIEKYRMATAYLSFITAGGQPIPDAKVKIEQTDHDFLFGTNRDLIMLGIISSGKYGIQIPRLWSERYNVSDKLIEKYTRRFIEFANYTSLPVGWNLYEKIKGKINYKFYDSEIRWLHENGINILAHNLVWNHFTPGWVPKDCNEITKAVEKRIRDFIFYYKGKFDYYVVFNEANRPFRSLFAKDRMTICFREIGKIPFVSMPFKVARAVDPTAKLMINEVSVLDHQGFPQLLKTLKDPNGKPLYDIIGIQSHMHNRIWPLDFIWKTLETYSFFNVPIHFTEVTVLSGTPISGKNYGKTTTPEGERQQAEYVVNLYTTLFSHPSVEAIQWWSLTDLGAWKSAPAGLLRKDMSPKPAYTALMNLIRKKWWTEVQTTTSKQGQCKFKGFLGTYRVTISPKGGKPETFNIKLTKKGKRNFRLVL